VFPVTITERVAAVTAALYRGRNLTSADVARMTGLTPGAALRLLHNVSRVVPVYDSFGVWRLVDANLNETEADPGALTIKTP
jgi:hypothetical protein